MLCSFALLVACIPLLTEKGSVEHKFSGLIYVPISMVALLLASWMAWRESSLVLFTFNCFCAYLLMSGWRAVHEDKSPSIIDWIIPGSLSAVALGVTLQALINDQGLRSFYLLFFAMNAFYLSWQAQPAAWMGRHIAGMVGSVIANLSVIVLTLLPLSLHWLWPVMLIVIGAMIAYKEHQKKLRVRQAMATILQPKFRARYTKAKDDDIRRAA